MLYPIIDTTLCRERAIDPVALAQACLRGGAEWLQVRGKDDSSASFTILTDRIVAAAHDVGANVIVNDRADIARLWRRRRRARRPDRSAGRRGPRHRRPGCDRRPLDARPRSRLMRRSRARPTTSPSVRSFSTATKDTGYTARGLELVSYAAGRGKPVVAIGGITLERAPSVVAAGASALAVISDILVGDDAEARVRAFLARPAATTRSRYTDAVFTPMPGADRTVREV